MSPLNTNLADIIGYYLIKEADVMNQFVTYRPIIFMIPGNIRNECISRVFYSNGSWRTQTNLHSLQ